MIGLFDFAKNRQLNRGLLSLNNSISIYLSKMSTGISEVISILTVYF